MDFITDFFCEIKTILLISTDILYKDEYYKLFENLINNKYVKKIICKVVRDFSGKEITFDFNFCIIEYFTSDIGGLNGFAGMGRVYISYSEQAKLYKLLDNYSESE